jgi:hypothetical protein
MSDETKKSFEPKKELARGASSSLRGWPGYRTREGRSGLDPYDNDAEAGHMAGVFLQRLLTGRLRIRSSIGLLLLAVLGVGCLLPLLLAIQEALRGNILPLSAWLTIGLAGLLGIAMLVNLVRNLFQFRKK